MPLSVRGTTAVLLLLGLSFAGLSCGESLGPNGEQIVTVENGAFNPATKTITAGETVLWKWASGAGTHNVTWVTSSGTGDSPDQSSGTYSRNFSAAGTYDYYCTFHGTPTGGMHGSIVVQ